MSSSISIVYSNVYDYRAYSLTVKRQFMKNSGKDRDELSLNIHCQYCNFFIVYL